MILPNFKTYPLLYPLAWLYELAVWCRNRAFDNGKLPSRSFDVPVICVGNITAGGTGKTPHIEYLIRLLQHEGIGPIAVLSRGYRRQTSGFVLAYPGVDASTIGDESAQIYRKFPDVIVAVDEKRCRGIEKLLALDVKPQVILLDDAFQHRYVKPGLSIVLTNYHRIIYQDELIPVGRLREPADNIDRADIVVVTKCPPSLRQEEKTEITGYIPTKSNQDIFYSGFQYQALVNLASGRDVALPSTCQVLIVTGIAFPEVLVNYVQTKFRLLDKLEYNDHHSFKEKDIKEIWEHLKAVSNNAYCTDDSTEDAVIITTEKDAARFMDCPYLTEELRKRIYYLPAEVYFLEDQTSTFNKKIIDYVRKNQRNSSLHSQ